jgi:hypothetical protein
MRRVDTRRGVQAVAWTLALLGVAGCSRPGPEQYVPAEPDARQALETVLRAWQDGQAPGPINTATPPVVAVDTLRRPGQQLRRYAILGEVPGEGPRCFAVRLLLDSPEEEQKARFIILGISPLWVFRQEDYERMIHWECNMTTEPERQPSPATPK